MGKAPAMPDVAVMAIRGGAPAVPAFMMLPAAIDETLLMKLCLRKGDKRDILPPGEK